MKTLRLAIVIGVFSLLVWGAANPKTPMAKDGPACIPDVNCPK